MTLTLLKSPGQLFCIMSLNFGLSHIIRLSLRTFGKNTREVSAHSVHRNGEKIPICLITGDRTFAI